MIDLDLEFIEIKFQGNFYKISKPNNKQIKEYSSKLKSCESDEQKEEALILFLESLGLKKELYELLNPTQLKKILSELYDSEKN